MMSILLVFIITGFFLICSAQQDCSKPPVMTNIPQCCKEIDIFKGVTPAECQSFKNTHTGEPGLTRDACFVECILNKTNILTNGEVDNTKVKGALLGTFKLDSETVNVMEKSFSTCIEEAKQLVSKITPLPALKSGIVCSPYPVVMMACVFRESFINCPSTKWQETSECDNIKQFFAACPLSHN